MGDNVILRCAFEIPKGNSPYVIHWLKDGQKTPIYIFYDGYPNYLEKEYAGRITLVNAEEASLNLSNVRDTDQGWYECKVFYLLEQNNGEDMDKNGTWVQLEVNCKYISMFALNYLVN